MFVTREIFEEISIDGRMHCDEFPLDSHDEELMYKIFTILPHHLQCSANEWGFNDTVFREDLVEYLCERFLNMSIEEYYESDIAKNYFENGILIKLNLSADGDIL